MWLSLTVWVSRLLVPLLSASVLVPPGTPSVLEQWVQGHAFALVALVLVLGVARTQPTVDATRDIPVRAFAAAAVGGLVAWAAAQALWFPSLSLMGWVAASLPHGLEVVMLGSVFAALVRRPLPALALGAGFQLAVMAVAALGLGLGL